MRAMASQLFERPVAVARVVGREAGEEGAAEPVTGVGRLAGTLLRLVAVIHFPFGS